MDNPFALMAPKSLPAPEIANCPKREAVLGNSRPKRYACFSNFAGHAAFAVAPAKPAKFANYLAWRASLRNSPTNLTDPTGEFIPLILIGVIIGAALIARSHLNAAAEALDEASLFFRIPLSEWDEERKQAYRDLMGVYEQELERGLIWGQVSFSLAAAPVAGWVAGGLAKLPWAGPVLGNIFVSGAITAGTVNVGIQAGTVGLGLQDRIDPINVLINAGIGGAASFIFAWLPKPVQALMPVSRWGRPGLLPGDWVMKGQANWWTYLWSGKWQPGFGNQFAPFGSGQTFWVSPSSVHWPGWEFVKGLLGQRLYIP